MTDVFDAAGPSDADTENPLGSDVESPALGDADVAQTDAALKKNDGDQVKLVVAQLSTTPTNW